MTTKDGWLYTAIIIGIVGVLMFSYLGSQPLMDPDEPVYAETAREMLQVHDFISPRIYGDFWYDKPPMYYWLVAAASQVFGSGEFAARFPSAFFAVGGTLLVYFSGRKLFNERAGLQGLSYAGAVVSAELIFPVRIIAGILTLLAAAILYHSFRHNFGKVFITYIVGMVVFTAYLMLHTLPAITPAVSVKPMVDEFKQQYDGQDPVYIAKFYRPGFMYYSGMAGIELNVDELAAAVLDKPDRAYFIVQKGKYDKLTSDIQSKLRVLAAQEDKILFVRDGN